jgi:serine/threonine-protein kinase
VTSEPLGSIGRYRIGARLGGGASGEVFAAEDDVLGREVALKVSRDHASHGRLLAEGRLAAKLTHPNLVAIYDIGSVDDVAFIAMELVHGVSLLHWLRRGPTDWLVAAAVASGVAGGLTALHDAGLVHRDVKPANVMIGRDGAVKVVDFGITVPEGTASPDGVSGSPGYIAPEIVLGGLARRSADVFGLGVVLHELVTGSRLFAGSTAVERMLATTRGRAPRLAEGRAPAWFVELVQACLAPEPRERLQHGRDVLAVLRVREPFADLATQVRASLETERAADEPTSVSLPVDRLVGRAAALAWLARPARTVWVHGPAGIGKTRLVRELVTRAEPATVLFVDRVSSHASMATALMLESAGDLRAMREALLGLSPVIVALEDVTEPSVALSLAELVRTTLPDALVVLTSELAPPASPAIESLRLPGLDPGEAEELLVERAGAEHVAVARALAPFAAGSPLCLELFARAIRSGKTTFDSIASGDVLARLCERVFVALTAEDRALVELLAVSAHRAALAAVLDDPRLDRLIGTLDAEGCIEWRDAGPELHAAFSAAVRARLLRDGQLDRALAELDGRLERRILTLVTAADANDPAAALRGLAAVRAQLVVSTDRALARGHALARSAALWPHVTDPSLPRLDGAAAVLERVIAALSAEHVAADVWAGVLLARAWSLDEDLDAALADVDRALGLGETVWRVAALTHRGSILKRQGRDREARAAYLAMREAAQAEGREGYARLAHWELLVNQVQAGDVEAGRRALASDPFEAIPGRLGPRTMVLRCLLCLEVDAVEASIRAGMRAIEGARALGQTRFLLITLPYVQEAHLRRGELHLADAAGRQACVLGRAMNLHQSVGHASHLLALSSLLAGRPHDAVARAREGHAAVTRATSHPGQIALARVIEALTWASAGVGDPGPLVDEARVLAAGTALYAPVVEVYVTLLEALRDPDAREQLAHLVAIGPPDRSTGELLLAHHVARALSSRPT